MGAVIATAVVALVVGFLAGLSVFRRSSRWCPACGSVLCCPDCPGQPSPGQVRAGAAAGEHAALRTARPWLRARTPDRCSAGRY